MNGVLSNLSQYVIKERQTGQGATGPYIRMILSRGGTDVKAVYWSAPQDVIAAAQVGTVVEVDGIWTERNGEKELKLTTLFVVPPEKITNLDDFLPKSPYNRAEQEERFARVLASIRDPHLKRFMDTLFSDETFKARFFRWPAAIRMHHAWLGGLLDHVLEVVNIVDRLAKMYPVLNRDLLIVGAIIHDVEKLREYKLGATIEMTDEGRLIGHVVMGMEWLSRWQEKINLPNHYYEELRHMIASHHGQREWGAVVEPMTPNAIALHLADLCSSRLAAAAQTVAEHKSNEAKAGEFWAGHRDNMLYLGFMEQTA